MHPAGSPADPRRHPDATPWSDVPDRLHARGLRWTPQRRVLIEVLSRSDGHVTGAELVERCRERDPATIPSTVYRTLAWLEDAGLVDHCHLDAGPENRHSERFDPVTPIEHHHFVCTACNRVIEFEAAHVESIKQEFAAQHGAAVERSSLTLYGLCPACQDTTTAALFSASRSHDGRH